MSDTVSAEGLPCTVHMDKGTGGGDRCVDEDDKQTIYVVTASQVSFVSAL